MKLIKNSQKMLTKEEKDKIRERGSEKQKVVDRYTNLARMASEKVLKRMARKRNFIDQYGFIKINLYWWEFDLGCIEYFINIMNDEGFRLVEVNTIPILPVHSFIFTKNKKEDNE